MIFHMSIKIKGYKEFLNKLLQLMEDKKKFTKREILAIVFMTIGLALCIASAVLAYFSYEMYSLLFVYISLLLCFIAFVCNRIGDMISIQISQLEYDQISNCVDAHIVNTANKTDICDLISEKLNRREKIFHIIWVGVSTIHIPIILALANMGIELIKNRTIEFDIYDFYFILGLFMGTLIFTIFVVFTLYNTLSEKIKFLSLYRDILLQYDFKK